MSNPTRLIRLALAALFESSRKHPGKLQALYYNMPSHLSVEQILSKSSISRNASSYGYSENEYEKLGVDTVTIQGLLLAMYLSDTSLASCCCPSRRSPLHFESIVNLFIKPKLARMNYSYSAANDSFNIKDCGD